MALFNAREATQKTMTN